MTTTATHEHGCELSASYHRPRTGPGNRVRYFDLRLPRIVANLGAYRAELVSWGEIVPFFWYNDFHQHSFYELCYSCQGRGTYTILGQELPVQAGDAFIARPGELHRVQSSRSAPLGIYCVSFALVPAGGMRHHPGDERVRAAVEGFMRSRRWSVPLPGGKPLLDHATEELVAQRAGWSVALEGLLAKLLVDIVRHLGAGPAGTRLVDTPAVTGNGEDEQRVRQAVRFLQDNYQRPLSVRDVARQVYLSERHLQRIFRRCTGKSVLQYLSGLRLESARQLLMEEARPIKTVAAECGFTDVRYFTSWFGKRVGMPPAAFRASGGGLASRK